MLFNSKCPWIFAKQEISTPLPTMAELVGFDPDMPQWEGDGELVGVRSKLIVTHSHEFVRPYGYKSNYMSQVRNWVQTIVTGSYGSNLYILAFLADHP